MFGFPKYFGLRGKKLCLAISYIAGLDFLLFGYDQGVTGGLLDLPSFTRHFSEIDPLQYAEHTSAYSTASTYQGITVAAYNLGCFCGAILCIFIGNPLGRTRAIFLGAMIMTVGAILQCTSYHLTQFIIGRIVTGIGNGISTSTVPTYQSETAHSHERGQLVMIEGMLITAGIALSYWINYGMSFIGAHEVSWRFPLAFQIVFAVIIWLTILNLPESPRWLLLKGRNEEALEVLEYLEDRTRDDAALMAEYDSVVATVEEMSAGSYRSLFKMSEYREFHRVVLAYVIQCFQQISGINLITYYAPTLYAQVGLGGGHLPKLLAACNGTEYLLASFIPIFIIEKAGRRKLMLFGAFGMAASMAILAACNWSLNAQGNKNAGYTQAAFLFIFNTAFAIGFLGMTWLYPAEIVPLRIRGPTTALSTSSNWLFNFLVVMITPPAFANIGYKTYIIFAVINAFIFPVIYFFYPETRYRSLEEMDGIFKKSTNVFDVVSISIKEPFRYDKNGNLKDEFIVESARRRSSVKLGTDTYEHKPESSDESMA